MSDSCEYYRNLIPRMLLDDLPGELKQEIEAHVRQCESCRTEQVEYLQTIRALQTAEDLPLPHHFFVAEAPRHASLGDWLRGLSFTRKLAAAGTTLGVIAFLWLALSGLQFKAENGVYAFSFGPALPELTREDQSAELRAFATELRQVLDQAMEAEREQYLALLDGRLEESSRQLNDEQRRILRAAVDRSEQRMNQRIAITREVLQNQTTLSIETLYNTLQTQRSQDLALIRHSMAQSAIQNEAKDLETQAVLSTLLEVADLRLRQLN
jgi:plasmid stability protein